MTCFVHGTKVNKVYAEAGQLFTLTLASGKPATLFKEGWAKIIRGFVEKGCYGFSLLLSPQNSYIEAGHGAVTPAFRMLRQEGHKCLANGSYIVSSNQLELRKGDLVSKKKKQIMLKSESQGDSIWRWSLWEVIRS